MAGSLKRKIQIQANPINAFCWLEGERTFIIGFNGP